MGGVISYRFPVFHPFLEIETFPSVRFLARPLLAFRSKGAVPAGGQTVEDKGDVFGDGPAGLHFP